MASADHTTCEPVLARLPHALPALIHVHSYAKIEPELAKKTWSQFYGDALNVCSHGPNCKNRGTCIVGKRLQASHVLTGSVLPYWTYIQNAVGHRYTDKGRKSKMSIVRVRFTGADGKEQRLVGISVATLAEVNRLKEQIQGASAASAASSSADVKPDVKPHLGGGAKPPDDKRFAPLAKVQIHGLMSAAALKFNFAIASVQKWHADEGRYNVIIKRGPFAGTPLKVKPENLMQLRD